MNKWKLKALKSLKWITIDKDGAVYAHTKNQKFNILTIGNPVWNMI